MDSEDGNPEAQSCPSPAVLSLHQVVSSASQMPVSPRKSPTARYISSQRHAQQYRLLMDHQRELFDEERRLWYTERLELYEKLSRLESSLRKYESLPSNQVPFSPKNHSRVPIGGPIITTAPSFKSTGDEFWRGAGGKSDAQPTRVFSDSTNQTFEGEKNHRLAENVVKQKPMVSSVQDSAVLAAQNRDIQSINENLDGIIFKQNPKISSISQSLMTPQSPSPSQSTSSAHLYPKTDVALTSLLTEPYDIYTKDAGHTPIAPRHNHQLDGSATLSVLVTPTKPENEKPPFEPHTSILRPPCERSDSYFPSVDEENGEVELKEPLGLTNNSHADKDFLEELNSKLHAARFDTLGSLESNSTEQPTEEGPSIDEPEPEPPLRIKKSMNFGAPFGSAHYAKGL